MAETKELTEEQFQSIRTDLTAGELSHKEIAEKHNTTEEEIQIVLTAIVYLEGLRVGQSYGK